MNVKDLFLTVIQKFISMILKAAMRVGGILRYIFWCHFGTVV